MIATLISHTVADNNKHEREILQWIDDHKHGPTKAKYQSSNRSFDKFRREAKFPTHENPTAVQVAKFAISEFEKGKARNTIRGHMSAITNSFKSTGKVAPTEHTLVSETMKIIAANTPEPTEREPLTEEQQQGMFKILDTNSLRDVRDFTMVVWSCKAGMRESEIVRLLSDKTFIKFTPEAHITSVLEHNPRQNKQNRNKNKRSKVIVLAPDGDARPHTCPWQWYHKYMRLQTEQLHKMKLTTKPTTVFYNLKTGRQLAKTHLNHALQRLLKKAGMTHVLNLQGVPVKSTSHCCRARAGTQGNKIPGAQKSLNMANGGWHSEDGITPYIKHNLEERIKFSKAL